MKSQLLFFLAILPSFSATALAEDYYVSPQGNDQNPGTRAKPFATILKARNTIRSLPNEARKRPLTVHLMDGLHFLREGFKLKPQDSGSENAPITYEAEHKWKAVISGAVPLKHLTWKPYQQNILKAKVPMQILKRCKFDQLWLGEKKLDMARFPNRSSHHVFNGVTNIKELNKRALNYKNPQTGYFHALHAHRWGSVHYKVTGVTTNGLQLKGGWQQNRRRRFNRGNVMIENIFEELDYPGEWFLHRKSATLYVYPPQGENLTSAPLYATHVKNLISFAGSQESPVRCINIEGIQFRHARRVFMESEHSWERLNRGDWSIVRSASVLMTGTERCRIRDCFFNSTGGNGVFFNNYNRQSLVVGCLFEKLGESAVCFVGNHDCTRSNPVGYGNSIPYSEQDLTPGPKGNDFPKQCKMEGCLVSAIGRVGKQTAGAFISMAQDITVSYNTIYHVPRSGITVNDGCWGGHIIEHNDVFDTVRETADHGPFNSWGRDRYWDTRHHGRKPYRKPVKTAGGETTSQLQSKKRAKLDCVKPVLIRNNRFMHDCRSHSWGIDLDDGSSNYHVYKNLCLGGSVKLREGFFRKVENNIFIGGAAIQVHVPFDHNSDYICRNIVVPESPKTIPWPTSKEKIKDAKKIDHNVYWSSQQYKDPEKENRQLKEFQAQGIDVHSISADPKFADPLHYDFRVAEDSPALKAGFNNFPMDQFGVRKPELKKIAEAAHEKYQRFDPADIWGEEQS